MALFLEGLAERRPRVLRGNEEGVSGASKGCAKPVNSNLGGAAIFFGGLSGAFVTAISVGSNRAEIQGVIPYSSASAIACSGGIHTLPAVSSWLVVGSDLIYLRSASSSAASAYGKVALNMPVADT
ncbi:hypothetical protein RRF57_005870 [Xylaria bambusicola]|uniref:Uncharacterized protein n=1 Tax=Xylaria bambusicola TaxID=326684 RepID=A0AAN7YY50_9PEZI